MWYQMISYAGTSLRNRWSAEVTKVEQTGNICCSYPAQILKLFQDLYGGALSPAFDAFSPRDLLSNLGEIFLLFHLFLCRQA